MEVQRLTRGAVHGALHRIDVRATTQPRMSVAFKLRCAPDTRMDPSAVMGPERPLTYAQLMARLAQRMPGSVNRGAPATGASGSSGMHAAHSEVAGSEQGAQQNGSDQRPTTAAAAPAAAPLTSGCTKTKTGASASTAAVTGAGTGLGTGTPLFGGMFHAPPAPTSSSSPSPAPFVFGAPTSGAPSFGASKLGGGMSGAPTFGAPVFGSAPAPAPAAATCSPATPAFAQPVFGSAAGNSRTPGSTPASTGVPTAAAAAGSTPASSSQSFWSKLVSASGSQVAPDKSWSSNKSPSTPAPAPEAGNSTTDKPQTSAERRRVTATRHDRAHITSPSPPGLNSSPPTNSSQQVPCTNQNQGSSSNSSSSSHTSQPPAPMLQLKIQTLTNRNYTFHLPADAPLSSLGLALEDANGTPPDQSRFIYGGRELGQHYPIHTRLCDMGIVDGATIHMVMRLRD